MLYYIYDVYLHINLSRKMGGYAKKFWEKNMWTVVFVSQDRDKVQRLVLVLNDNGIMTRVQYSHEDDFSEFEICEILVPSTELETAQDIIFDNEI